MECLFIVLPKQRFTKAQIRLRGGAVSLFLIIYCVHIHVNGHESNDIILDKRLTCRRYIYCKNTYIWWVFLFGAFGGKKNRKNMRPRNTISNIVTK